ncbi:MAG: CAP domain-containing protein [Thermomicrobiales bacterium]|nr:CAP domain-containing protein [Thermomicrobiales bacterium]
MRHLRSAVLAAMLLVGGATSQGLAESRHANLPAVNWPARTTTAAMRVTYAPDTQECKFLRQVNGYRKKRKLPALQLSASLGAAAEHHSADMARRDYFSHNLKGNVSWKQNIRKFGYKGNPVGENIAAGMADSAAAFKSWKKSAGHRRNMLNRGFRSIGIGRAHNNHAEYGWYWTTTFGGSADDVVRC